MERILLVTISKHMKENVSSQHGYLMGKSCLVNLIAFYNEMTVSVNEQRTVHLVYHDFSKAFDAFYCNVLIDKQMKWGLDKWTARWTKTCLNWWVQSTMTAGAKSTWKPVTSEVPWGLILGLVQLNIFINYVDDGTECSLSQPGDDKKLGRVTDTPEGYAQRDPVNPEKWAARILIKFNKSKCEVLHLERNNHMH